MSLLDAIKSLVLNTNETAREKYRRLLAGDDPAAAKTVVALARELGRDPADIESDRELVHRAAMLEVEAQRIEELSAASHTAMKHFRAEQARGVELVKAAQAEAARIERTADIEARKARSAFERARDAGVELDRVEAELDKRLTAGANFPPAVEPGFGSSLSSHERAVRDAMRRGSDEARERQLEQEAGWIVRGVSKPPEPSRSMDSYDRAKVGRAIALGWKMPAHYESKWREANGESVSSVGIVERH